jgi:hypothetical protein
MWRWPKRRRAGSGVLVASSVGLAIVLASCSASRSNGPSRGAAQSTASSPVSVAVKSPTWAAGYWIGHQRTLDLAPNGVGLLVISLSGGGVGPFATIQLHVSAAGPTQATVVIDSSDDPKTVIGSTHVVRYDVGADVITIDLDQQTQNFCGVTAAPGTCGA